jgi:hypothetical protein
MVLAQRIGVALVAVGTAATVVTLWPLVTGGQPNGLGWYLAAMLAPLGLGVILATFWHQARARGRRHR